MFEDYVRYCFGHSWFLDTTRYRSIDIPLVRTLPALPTDWTVIEDAEWTYVEPTGEIPRQGWKLHVSATPDNCSEVLAAAASICVRHRAAFKFAPNAGALMLKNAKYGHRSSSGKFMAIYPTPEQLTDLVEDLDL